MNILLIVLYIASVVFSFGALNADNCHFANKMEFEPQRVWRESLPFAVFGSLVPGANLLWACMLTGFLQDGWHLGGLSTYNEGHDQ